MSFDKRLDHLVSLTDSIIRAKAVNPITMDNRLIPDKANSLLRELERINHSEIYFKLREIRNYLEKPEFRKFLGKKVPEKNIVSLYDSIFEVMQYL